MEQAIRPNLYRIGKNQSIEAKPRSSFKTMPGNGMRGIRQFF